MILAIHHIQLAMPPGGEDRARAFYSGVLGFEEVRKPEHLAKRAAKKAHPAFLVDDVQKIADACSAIASSC